jgi:hypothetical protein
MKRGGMGNQDRATPVSAKHQGCHGDEKLQSDRSGVLCGRVTFRIYGNIRDVTRMAGGRGWLAGMGC